MIKEGLLLEINGKKGVVCFTTTYQNKNYVNVGFDDNVYKIYEVTIKGENAHFKEVLDKKLTKELIDIFVEDGVKSFKGE